MRRWDDTDAELAVTGCAVATAHGASYALTNLVTADHFHDRRLARLLTAAQQIKAVAPVDVERRIDAVCAMTGEQWSYVEPIVRNRPVMHDRTGYYARRVIAACEHRNRLRSMRDCLSIMGYDVALTSKPVTSWL